MSEQTGQSLTSKYVSENRQEWFSMLVSYMKMKTLLMWLTYYPETSLESFELIWPRLLDQMLAHATEAACEQLKESKVMSLN